MKKLLTLVLCWLLAFSAIAETTFKAKTAASVAGGYVTSLNKVDGSFEDGTSQWLASADNIVKTASTEMQGNNIGVWTGTGTQTLDLQWIATASNTYEASAQVDVQGEDDVYVCAYVGTAETGCKLIPALSKIQKVSVVADSVMSSAFYLRLKHTGSDAFSIKVDDGKIEPWTPQAVNLVEQESYRIKQVGTSLLDRNSDIRFNLATASIDSSLKNVLKVEDDISNSRTKFTAIKKCTITVSAKLAISSAGQWAYFYKYPENIPFGTGNTVYSTNQYSIASGQIELNAGDFITLVAGSAVSSTSDLAELTLTATAISENVVQSWQPSDFLGEIKLLPSTTAPRGFIPADGKSIGKTSGNYQGDAYYALYALRWAMASTTAGEPYVISSAKGASAQADWDAGKTITIDVRGMFFRAAGGNAGAVGSKQLDAFQGHEHRIGYYSVVGTRTDSFVLANDLTSWSTNSDLQNGYNDDGTNGTPRVASETRPINTSEYAYMRYGTSAPDLIALPTSKDNNKTYNETHAPLTVTGKTISSYNASYYPYRTISKVTGLPVWRMAFNAGITVTAGATNFEVNFSSVLFKGASINANGGGATANIGAVGGETNKANVYFNSPVTFFQLSGDVELAGKPTWADEWVEPGVFVGSLAKDYTAYVDASEAITNATDNFITSCTNADPTVCTFATNKFGTPPYCNAQKTSSADVYVTTTSTTSVTIERADASSPFSLFCQIK